MCVHVCYWRAWYILIFTHILFLRHFNDNKWIWIAYEWRPVVCSPFRIFLCRIHCKVVLGDVSGEIFTGSFSKYILSFCWIFSSFVIHANRVIVGKSSMTNLWYWLYCKPLSLIPVGCEKSIQFALIRCGSGWYDFICQFQFKTTITTNI